MQLTLSLAAIVGTAGAAQSFIRARGGQPQAKKSVVHLDLYFESLCPYCHALLDEPFRRIWGEKDFRDRITVDLIPFGNAMVVPGDKISQGYHFFHPDATYPVIICQHKEGECLGNEIQACVNHMHGTNTAVEFTLCMVGKQVKGQGIEMSSYDCMQELKIAPQPVKNCVGSDESRTRMIGHGERSMRPQLNRSYVPWVMADDAHVEMDDDHDLITPLCAMLAEPLPKLCSEPKPEKPKANTSSLLQQPTPVRRSPAVRAPQSQ